MSQPPGQQPDEQPQYGQPPYGHPQYGQPQYGQPPYGPPQPGSGGYYAPPVKQGNGFAVAGIILAIFVPILGLIFSIIGLVTSKARAGAGKTLSIVGIVVSIVVGAGASVAVALAIHSVAQSPAADPGCISAERNARQVASTLNADDAALTKDENNPAAVRADLQKFLSDMQSVQGPLSSAEDQAQHQLVKTRIAALTSDISAFDSAMQAIENGDTSQASQANALATKLQHDGDALDSTCSTL
jgi:hypothetical protein